MPTGTPAGAPAAIIRCPDWQRYAPPVHLATIRDGQTAEAFSRRTAQGAAGGTPPKTNRATPATGASALRSAPRCSHTIVSGDTFGTLAARHLGRARRWPEIQAANPGVKPERLRIGQVINLPCAAPATAQPATASDSSPASGTHFLARLFGGAGGKPASTASSTDKPPATPVRTAPASPKAAAGTPAAAPDAARPITKAASVVPSTPPLPLWTARRGAYLADVLRRWGKTAGYTVIIDSNDAWRLGVPIRLRASFEDAVAELVSGLAHDGTPPRVRLYPNAVLRLGGPL